MLSAPPPFMRSIDRLSTTPLLPGESPRATWLDAAADRDRPPGSRPSPSYDCAPSRATDTLAWHEPDRSQKAHRAAVARDPGARPALLRRGPAGGLRRRVRSAVPRAGGPR